MIVRWKKSSWFAVVIFKAEHVLSRDLNHSDFNLIRACLYFYCILTDMRLIKKINVSANKWDIETWNYRIFMDPIPFPPGSRWLKINRNVVVDYDSKLQIFLESFLKSSGMQRLFTEYSFSFTEVDIHDAWCFEATIILSNCTGYEIPWIL